MHTLIVVVCLFLIGLVATSWKFLRDYRDRYGDTTKYLIAVAATFIGVFLGATLARLDSDRIERERALRIVRAAAQDARNVAVEAANECGSAILDRQQYSPASRAAYWSLRARALRRCAVAACALQSNIVLSQVSRAGLTRLGAALAETENAFDDVHVSDSATTAYWSRCGDYGRKALLLSDLLVVEQDLLGHGPNEKRAERAYRLAHDSRREAEEFIWQSFLASSRDSLAELFGMPQSARKAIDKEISREFRERQRAQEREERYERRAYQKFVDRIGLTRADSLWPTMRDSLIQMER